MCHSCLPLRELRHNLVLLVELGQLQRVNLLFMILIALAELSAYHS